MFKKYIIGTDSFRGRGDFVLTGAPEDLCNANKTKLRVQVCDVELIMLLLQGQSIVVTKRRHVSMRGSFLRFVVLNKIHA